MFVTHPVSAETYFSTESKSFSFFKLVRRAINYMVSRVEQGYTRMLEARRTTICNRIKELDRLVGEIKRDLEEEEDMIKIKLAHPPFKQA